MYYIFALIFVLVILIYFRNRSIAKQSTDGAELVAELLDEYKKKGTVSVNQDQAEKALSTIDHQWGHPIIPLSRQN